MATLYELQIVAGHRFNELSIRLKNGKKVWVGKDKVTIVGSADLAQGEEVTIERYQREGRMVVGKVDAEVEVEVEAKPRPKRVRGKTTDLEV